MSLQSFPVMTIGNDDAKPSKRNRPRKTRSFQCLLLRAVVWTDYRDDKRWMRPVFLDFCGSESMHRAFVANLRCGRVAQLGNASRPEGFELLRSEPYLYAPAQRCEAGVRQIVYYPGLFDVDVKSQSDDVWLVVMPPSSMLRTVREDEVLSARAVLRRVNGNVAAVRQQIEAENAAVEYWRRRDLPKEIELSDEALATWAVVARELAVRLDARTKYPVPTPPEFRAALLYRLMTLGAVTLSDGHVLSGLCKQRDSRYNQGLLVKGPSLDWRNVDNVGYMAPTALRIKQTDLGPVLADLAREYYAGR